MLTRQNNKIVTLFFANKTKHNLEKGGGARAVQVIYETSNFFNALRLYELVSNI